MKHTKNILFLLVLISTAILLTPYVSPQVGTYTFHGAAGNEKVLVVRTADNASLEIVFGAGYVGVIENSFGTGALVEGARKKSLVTDVNFSHIIDYSGFYYNVFVVAGVAAGVKENPILYSFTFLCPGTRSDFIHLYFVHS